MSAHTITVKYSVFVKKPPEAVWDFTQDYTLRPRWDSAVLEAVEITDAPTRTVRLRMRGNTTMTFVYKQFERPRKTSLLAKEVVSPTIASAGGAWFYEAKEGGTVWTQTNTVTLKDKLLLSWLKPLFRWGLRHQTRSAMNQAKRMMEKGG